MPTCRKGGRDAYMQERGRGCLHTGKGDQISAPLSSLPACLFPLLPACLPLPPPLCLPASYPPLPACLPLTPPLCLLCPSSPPACPAPHQVRLSDGTPLDSFRLDHDYVDLSHGGGLSVQGGLVTVLAVSHGGGLRVEGHACTCTATSWPVPPGLYLPPLALHPSRSWALDPGTWILDPVPGNMDPGSWNVDP